MIKVTFTDGSQALQPIEADTLAEAHALKRNLETKGYFDIQVTQRELKKMSFTEWVEVETGISWHALKALGTERDQLHRLYADYELHCKENHVSTNWDFQNN